MAGMINGDLVELAEYIQQQQGIEIKGSCSLYELYISYRDGLCLAILTITDKRIGCFEVPVQSIHLQDRSVLNCLIQVKKEYALYTECKFCSRLRKCVNGGCVNCNSELLTKFVGTKEIVTCAVCLSDIYCGSFMLRCKHSFHRDCITKTAERSNRCPLCRADICDCEVCHAVHSSSSSSDEDVSM